MATSAGRFEDWATTESRRLDVLDPIADRVAGLTQDSRSIIVRLARGEPIGHPVHPALTDLPIGFWTSATLIDVLGGSRVTARRLVGAGVLTALPTIVAGVADFPQLPSDKRRVAIVHATANLLATIGYAASWRRRRLGRSGIGIGLLAGALATLGGSLGGWLVFGPSPDDDPDDAAERLVGHLGDRRIATAESCTGGRVAETLVAVEGASEFFAGSIVAYDETVKRDVLDVRAPSVYSEAAVVEMALGACELFEVDAAVATSGVAGGQDDQGVPAGTVFIGTAVDGVGRAAKYEFHGSPDEVVDAARGQALRDLDAALLGGPGRSDESRPREPGDVAEESR